MRIPPPLRQAYADTRYRVIHAGGVIDLRVGQPSPAVATLLAGARSAAVVTAWNPFSELQPAAANAAANERLAADLAARGLRFYRTVGAAPDGSWHEDGYLALGVDRHAARALCVRHRQSAVLQVPCADAPELVWHPDATHDVRVAVARSAQDYAAGRELFTEYERALGVDLCFQGFAGELETLPAMYGPPRGCLLLGFVDGRLAGCVAVRPRTGSDCEMKRLYVRPFARGTGLGRTLAAAAVGFGREAGYARMVLDTLGRLAAALALYDSMGFRPVEPYYGNPLEDVRFLARDLRGD